MDHCEDVLYSVNTLLAYKINEKFYKGRHYIWCAPRFDEPDNPPSANPKDIFLGLCNDIERSDKHSAKVEQNRMGLIRGVEENFKIGLIDESNREELIRIIQNAQLNHFRPLIYIINKSAVRERINLVPVNDRAELFSNEFKITDLRTNEFDIIDLKLLK